MAIELSTVKEVVPDASDAEQKLMRLTRAWRDLFPYESIGTDHLFLRWIVSQVFDSRLDLMVSDELCAYSSSKFVTVRSRIALAVVKASCLQRILETREATEELNRKFIKAFLIRGWRELLIHAARL